MKSEAERQTCLRTLRASSTSAFYNLHREVCRTRFSLEGVQRRPNAIAEICHGSAEIVYSA